MNPTLPLFLILGAYSSGQAWLERADRRAINRFSARWSVQFAPVFPTQDALGRASRTHYPPSEPIVARIEALLDAARLALARLDHAEASEGLVAAERLLHEHPELPQAAWLRAEQLTLAAELADQTGGGGSRELRNRAMALEGPRAPQFRESGSFPPPPMAPDLSVAIRGPDNRDAVEWNGTRVFGTVSTRIGEHAVRVQRRGQTVWAGWVTVDATTSHVNLNVPLIEPCSPDDLAGTRVQSLGPAAPTTVRCRAWAVAHRNAGELEIAICRRSECGNWHRLGSDPEPFRAPAQHLPSRGFPVWASVALAGVGAALATSVVLWQTGTFERDTRTRERWIYDGMRNPDTAKLSTK